VSDVTQISRDDAARARSPSRSVRALASQNCSIIRRRLVNARRTVASVGGRAVGFSPIVA